MTAYYGIGYLNVREDVGCSAPRPGRIVHTYRNRKSNMNRAYALLIVFVFGIMFGICFTITAAASPDHTALSLYEETVAGADVERAAAESEAYTYVVGTGDTLWQIAREHMPSHTNIRDYIEQLKVVNGLTGSILYEGMKLRLP